MSRLSIEMSIHNCKEFVIRTFTKSAAIAWIELDFVNEDGKAVETLTVFGLGPTLPNFRHAPSDEDPR